MLKIIAKKRFKIIFLLFVAILQMLAIMKTQLLKGELIDSALANQNSIVRILVWLFVAIIVNKLLTYLYSSIGMSIAQEFSFFLRKIFFNSLFSRRYSDLAKLNEGEIIAKYSNQLKSIGRNLFHAFIPFFENILTIIFSLVTIFYLNNIIAGVSLIVLSLPVFIPIFFKKKLQKASSKIMKSIEALLSSFNNYLESFEIIKNYGIEEKIQNRFNKSNTEVLHAQTNEVKANSLVVGISFATSLLAQASLVIFTAYFVFIGKVSSGNFVTILSLCFLLNSPLYWIASQTQTILSTRPIVNSVFSFINEGNSNKINSKNKEQKTTIAKNEFKTLSLKELSFSYPNSKSSVLNKINIDFEVNKKYLIIGESGSGKSTIMSLILNYFNPTSGSIKINNIPLKNIENLNEIITISWQQAIIFEETLRNNLTLYDEEKFSDEDLLLVLRQVGLERLANNQDLNLPLKEKGENLSGGEKKRLSVARALLRKNPVLILDEPLENIDKKNVGKIEDEILNIENKMLIVISHQFTESKLKHFDFIFELKGGRLYEKVLA